MKSIRKVGGGVGGTGGGGGGGGGGWGGGGGVLKFVTGLRIILLLNNRSIVQF